MIYNSKQEYTFYLILHLFYASSVSNLPQGSNDGPAGGFHYRITYCINPKFIVFRESKVIDSRQCAAAILKAPPANAPQIPEGQVRIAFDGDAVLFSDESERVYQQAGLEAFQSHERQSARELLGGGPFKPFLAALHRLQQEFPEEQCPIRTALVTARSAPAHERVIRTLREWNIRLDESFFLGGLEKAAILETFGADVFFDDQAGHCDKAREVVATGHVPHGISNEPQL